MRRNLLKFFINFFVAIAIFSFVMPPAIFAKYRSFSSKSYSSKSYKSNSWSTKTYSRPKTNNFNWGRKQKRNNTTAVVKTHKREKKKNITPVVKTHKKPRNNTIPNVVKTHKGNKRITPIVKTHKKDQSIVKNTGSNNVASAGFNRGSPKVQTVKKKIKPKKLAGLTNKRDLNTTIKQRAGAEEIKKNRRKYTKPANTSTTNINTRNKLYTNTVSNQTKTVKEVTVIRNNYYGSTFHSPGWAMHCSPTYGMWETDFIIHSMMRGHYGLFYHHHNDRGMRDAMAEIREQAEENAELRAKLREMDREVARMETRGVTRNEEYLPKGASREIAMATELVAKQDVVETKEIITLATAKSTGDYYKVGAIMARVAESIDAPFTINPVSTPGSVYNLERFGKEFGIIMCQSDAADLYLQRNNAISLGEIQTTMYDEYFMFFKNAKCDIDDAGDLDPDKHIVIVGPKLSGPESSWENIKKHAASGWFKEKKYSKMKTLNMSYTKGLEMVAKNPKAVMLYVGGMNNNIAKIADTKYAGKINLIPFQERKFLKAEDKDGEKVYSKAVIPGLYENLQPKRLFSGNKPTESLTVMATMAISEEVLREHPEWEEDLKAIIMLTQGEIASIVGQ